MQRSEQINELVAALAKSQNQFTPVNKKKTAKVVSKRTGGEFTYKYADLADCLEMALPILSANQIALSQPHVLNNGKLRVTTLLMHSSGQWIQSDGIEISEEGDPQQFGAESTYFRRYDACSFCGIAPDEDTDAQQAGNRQRRTTPAQAMSEPAHASQETGMYDSPPPVPTVSEYDAKLWAEAFAECDTIEQWNKLIVPMMKERFTTPGYGKPFIRAAADEAKKRGYKPNRTSGLYEEVAA